MSAEEMSHSHSLRIQDSSRDIKSTTGLFALKDILSRKCPGGRLRSGDYIEVIVVHSFMVRKKGMTECHFIFADNQNHISAIFYSYGQSEEEEPEIYQKLTMVDTVHQIYNFVVEDATRAHREDTSFIIRNQFKRIKILNDSSCDMKHFTVPREEIYQRFRTHIPFQSTRLDEIERCPDGEIIDVIAVVANIKYCEPVNGGFPRILQLCHKLPGGMNYSNTTKYTYLKLDERLTDQLLVTDFMYAFSNIKVVADPTKEFNLLSTNSSFILEGTSLELLGDVSDQLSSTFSKLSTPSQEQNTLEVKLQPPQARSILSEQVADCSSSFSLPMESLPLTTSSSVENQEWSCSPAKRGRSTPDAESRKKLCQRQSLSEMESEINGIPTLSDDITDTPQEFYDCINGGHYYDVNVTPARQFMDNTYGETYHMRSEIRGVALIINNVFPESSRKHREGTDTDVRNLWKLLIQCGFQVMIKTDLRSNEVPGAIEEFKKLVAEKGTNKVDSIFVAILSHGEQGFVEMVDNINVNLYGDIINRFDEYSYPEFEGKPKIFVVQTCQNNPTSESLQRVNDLQPSPANTIMKNIIVLHGTACPGQSAYRDVQLGTYLIYVFVYVMMRHAHNKHFEEMLDLIQNRMQKIKMDFRNKTVCCHWIKYQFNKKLYFNPGVN